MDNDINGCSTCKPGQESYRSSPSTDSNEVLIQYNYRAEGGDLFSCVKPTIEQCRLERDRWLMRTYAPPADFKQFMGGSKERYFTGKRGRHGTVVNEVKCINDEMVQLQLRHYERHSPDGFEWGYGGSGPADLARSLLLAVFPNFEGTVEHLYQRFKFDVVAGFRSEWIIKEQTIKDWWIERVKEIKSEHELRELRKNE